MTLRTRGRLGQGFRFRRGKRSLKSGASQTDNKFFFAKKFVLLQSCYGIPKDLRNLHRLSYDDVNQWWQIYCSLRPVIRLWRLSLCRAAFVFVFVLKLKVNTETNRT